MRKLLFCAMIFSISAFVSALQVNAQGVVLGGYKEIPKTDGNAKKAALFAVSAEAKKSEKEIEFIAVIKAERQSLRGANYRLCLKVSDSGAEGQDAAEVFVKTVVFDDLKGNYKLTSWEASDCGEEEDEAGNMQATGSSPSNFKPDTKYKAVEISDPGADLAAQNAIRQHTSKTKAKITFGEMIKVEDKEPRIGTRDFRLCMSVVNYGQPGRAQALVSMDQYSNFKLTSWENTNCGVSTDGFTTVANADPGIGLAADFAVQQHSKDTKKPHKLASIIKAENKGLFAITYRVCMKVAEEGKTQVVRTVVTMDQYSNMKLVSWEHSKCGS